MSTSWAVSASAEACRRRSATGRVALVLTLGALAVLGCRFDRRPMHADNPPGRWVVVGPGDTLVDLARRAGVAGEDILELNGLAGPEDVVAGRLIFVLEPSPLPLAAGNLAIAVDPGGRPALRWPLPSAGLVVGSPFGAREGRPHEGIDLPAPVGTPVFAAADGQVAYAGNGIRGYGNLVVLRHAGDLLTVYAHASMLLVARGQPVRAGDRIALVGQSGHATGPHLHFEVRAGQIPQDPMTFLPELPR